MAKFMVKVFFFTWLLPTGKNYYKFACKLIDGIVIM